ncbi:glycosyltransferase [Fodinibacter luteus]|uniref:glycosyltransferase n=1 Tax=Fodinibacter luteus TaxID=552064 RepID=UPI0031F0D567
MIYLTRSWPRLSQTFVVNEVLALERRGVDLEVHAMAPSGEEVRQPQVDRVRRPVRYTTDAAPPADHALVAARWPQRYDATSRFAGEQPGLSSGYANATTRQCFEHAVQLAARCLRLEADGIRVTHLHAHFAHDPALVALLHHRLTGLTYSITAHARDLYQIPPENLRTRVASATSVLTCCRANVDYLDAHLEPSVAERVRVVHHGIDLEQFTPRSHPAGERVPRVVSVGRLVEKKGFPDLLRACAALAPDRPFRLTVLGDGPLRPALEAQRTALGLDGVVDFEGEHDSSVVVETMRAADVFALTPYVTTDGDRDGVPNVVVEAMAAGLPVVATEVGGVGEAVTHGHDGLLCAPRDVAAIAANLGELLADPARRQEMGRRARATVEASFDVDRAAEQLVDVFSLAARPRAHYEAFLGAIDPARMPVGEGGGDCVVLDAKFEPGRPATVLYRHATRLVHATVEPSGVTVEEFPTDPALPTLPAVLDPAVLGPALAGAIGDPDAERVEARLRLLRYRPGRRATVEVTLGGGPAQGRYVAKVYHDGAKAAAVAAEGAALVGRPSRAPLLLAPVVAHLPDLAVVAQAWVEGVPLTDADAPRAAAALAVLHGLSVPAGRPRPVDRELRRFVSRSMAIRSVDPEAGEPLLELAERLHSTQAPPGPASLVHGDCKPSQFLACGDDVAILDLDHCGVADPASDVGTFVATLRQQAIRSNPSDPCAADATEPTARAFVDAYRDAVAPEPEGTFAARVDFYVAVALMRKALRAFARSPLSDEPRLVAADARRGLDTPWRNQHVLG